MPDASASDALSLAASPRQLTLHAHAKLNLCLGVAGPQPPRGYHPIASWFTSIGLGDTITLKVLPPGQRSRYDIAWALDAPRPTAIDWPIEKDLGVRAHRLLEQAAGRPLPIHLRVDKRTPVGGGLGGGSSDAAAVMIGVCALFGLKHALASLHSMSAALGSDVAFFIDEPGRAARPAMVSGYGELIRRMPWQKPAATEAVLIIPPYGCPTGPVYQAFDLSPAAARPGNIDWSRVEHAIGDALQSGVIQSERLFNDLAEPACAVEPRLAELLAMLRQAFGPLTPVHVTGSGSTLFALAPVGQGAMIARLVREAAPQCAVLVSPIL